MKYFFTDEGVVEIPQLSASVSNANSAIAQLASELPRHFTVTEFVPENPTLSEVGFLMDYFLAFSCTVPNCYLEQVNTVQDLLAETAHESEAFYSQNVESFIMAEMLEDIVTPEMAHYLR